MATAALRLTGNIAFNRGNGTVVQMEQVGFPAHVITSGRLDSARLPANPQIFGNLTPIANLTYDLGSAEYRWKDLWLSGAVTGNGAGLTALDAGQVTIGTQIRIGEGAGANVQSINAVAIGVNAGSNTQGPDAVAVGRDAGTTSQGSQAVAIGVLAGRDSQGSSSVAIGRAAGVISQGSNAVAIGHVSGSNVQGNLAVAIGAFSARISQGSNAVAVGNRAGSNTQGSSAVAVGNEAGATSQSANAVAIGSSAGYNLQGNLAVAIGFQAGANVQAERAVAIGYLAGFNTQGASATAVGQRAGETTQDVNATAIGSAAGQTNQGNQATAVGRLAGASNQGVNATAIGTAAGSNAQSSGATAVGTNAGAVVQGLRATAVGMNAGISNQGSQATAIGDSAGSNLQGNLAVAVGVSAGRSNQGIEAVAVGPNAGHYGQGAASVAIGSCAGISNQGEFSTAVGYFAGESNQRDNATALGYSAGRINQGNFATALGGFAGCNAQGNLAIAIGWVAGRISQGTSSVAIGYLAGSNSQGFSATAIGTSAAFFKQGNVAVALGAASGQSNQGDNAIAIGREAGFTGQDNQAIAIGYVAGSNAQGLQSVAIGYQAARISQGVNAVAVGVNAGYSNQGQNAVAIGSTAGFSGQGSNSIVINATGANVPSAGVNTCVIKPIRGLDAGTHFLKWRTTTAEVTYDTSSRRYKKNIEDLSVDTSVVYDLRPREFDYDILEDKDVYRRQFGYIAEEADAVDPHFVIRDGQGRPDAIEWFNMLTYGLTELRNLRDGATYAEYYEAVDANAIPQVGETVALVGDRVVRAEEGADAVIVGVVRPKRPTQQQVTVQNAAENEWVGKYLRDDFGAFVMESHDIVEWTETIEIQAATPAQYKTVQHEYEVDKIPENVQVPTDGSATTETRFRTEYHTMEFMVWTDAETGLYHEFPIDPASPVVDLAVPEDARREVRTVEDPDVPYDVISWTETTDEIETPASPAVTQVVPYKFESHALPPGIVVPETAVITPNAGVHRALNPAYDPARPYVPRSKRAEWVQIALMGRVAVLKTAPKNPAWIKLRDVSPTVEEWLIR